MGKRILSILCAVILALSPISIPAGTVQAQEAEPNAKLLTLSDYQKWSSSWTDDWDFLKNQLQGIVNGAYDAGADPDYMLFGGDFTCLGSATAESEEGMSQVKSILRSKWPGLTDDKMVLVQGNHDLAGDYGLAKTGAYEFDDFIIYVINEDDFPSKQGESSVKAIVQKTTDDLKTWMDNAIARKETRPILIASHTGLHYDIDRQDGNNQFASILFDAINEAAKQLDIIFLFGHNHTNGDEQVGGSLTFFSPGEKLGVCTTDSIARRSGTARNLNFTYMNYGYVGYIGDITNQDTTIDPTNLLTVSQMNFYDGRITVDRYSANGLEEAYSREVKLKNYPEWSDLKECSLTLHTNGTDMEDASIKTVESYVMLEESNVPERDGFIFCGWTENEDGTGISYKVGDVFYLDQDMDLYAQWKEIPDGQQYKLTDALRPGKEYIMVWNEEISGNEGTKYAMTANGAEVNSTVLNEDNFVTKDLMVIPEDTDTSAYTWDTIWNQGVNPAQGYLFRNKATDTWLKHSASALSLEADPVGTQAGQVAGGDLNSSTAFQDYVWNYRDYNGYRQLAVYGNNNSYIRYSVGGKTFKFGSTSVSTDVNNSHVYLYEKTEPTEYRWELADSLESGEKYLVVSAKEDGVAQTLTATGRTIGSKKVKIQSEESGVPYIDYDCAYGDAAVFYSYGIREGNYWLESWNSISDGGVVRLNASSVGITSSHGDDDYYFRFKYEEGALKAYNGLAGTDSRTMVYNNGFTVGTGENVYLFKRVPAEKPQIEEEPSENPKYVLTDSVRPGKQYIMVWNADISGNEGTKYAITAENGNIAPTILDEKYIEGDTITFSGGEDTSSYTWNVMWNQGSNPARGYLFQNESTEGYLSSDLTLGADVLGTEYNTVNNSTRFASYAWTYNDLGQLVKYSDNTQFIRYSVGSAKFKFGKTSTASDVNNSHVYLYEKAEPEVYRWEPAASLESGERYLVVSANEAGDAKILTATGRTIGEKDVKIQEYRKGGSFIDYLAEYGDAAVFYSYAANADTFWLDSWNSISDGGVIKLDETAIGVTSSHGDNRYYFRFNYEDGALKAYSGLAGTDSRTMVYNNGFAVGDGSNVYLYKLTAKVAVDKSALQAAIARAVPAEDAELYTEESWEAYTKALQEANDVQNDEYATWSDVREAEKMLSDAQKALEFKPEPKPEIPEVLADFTFDQADADGAIDGGYAIAEGSYTLEDHNDGKALKLDGISQHLVVTGKNGTSLLTDVKEMTVSYQIKPENSKTNWGFFAAPNADTQKYQQEHYVGIVDISGTTNAERYNNSGARPAVANYATGYNGWYYVTVVYTEGATTLYVDGVKVAEEASTYALTDILGENSILYIGKATWVTGEYATALIDNYKIVSKALTDEEVKAEAAKYVEKDALKAAIDAKVDEKDTYTSDTWKAYEDALAAANTVYSKADATQGEVDSAAAALKNAAAKLVKRGDKTALQEAIKNAVPEEDKEKYTESSWEAYEKALADAKEVENDADATERAVTNAVRALENAQKNLKETEPEPPVLERPFVDVDEVEGAWYYDAVYYNFDKGIMNGVNKEHFEPLSNLARAQFAIILHNMEGKPDVSYEAKFADVADGQWYTDAILWASSKGIVTGYTDGSNNFGWGDNILREQMAVMMYRYAKNFKEYDVSDSADFDNFEDSALVDDYAKDAMKWAVGAGIITGKDLDKDGTPESLDPSGNASRAECAIIIQRFLEKYAE